MKLKWIFLGAVGVFLFGISSSFVFAIHAKSDTNNCRTNFAFDGFPDRHLVAFQFPCGQTNAIAESQLSRSKLLEVTGGLTVGDQSSSGHREGVAARITNYADRLLVESCLGGSMTVNYYTGAPEYTLSYKDCSPLESVMKLCVNGQCNFRGDPSGDIKINVGSRIVLTWSTDFIKVIESPPISPHASSIGYQPAKSCSMTGPAINRSDLSSGNSPFDRSFEDRGIYKYDFTCEGFTEASRSSSRGSVSKTVYINVGNVQAPQVSNLSVSPEPSQIIASEVNKVTLRFKIDNSADVKPINIAGCPPVSPTDTSVECSIGTEPKTFTLTVESLWPDAFPPVTRSITVTPVIPPEPLASCQVSPDSVQAGKGSEVELSWSISNPEESKVESFYIFSDPVTVQRLTDFKETTGSKKIFIPGSARGDIGLSMNIKSGWKYWQQPGLAPQVYCGSIDITHPDKPTIVSFKAVPETIKSGEKAVLEWEVQNARQVVIDRGVGTKPLKGTFEITPKFTTTYTLTTSGEIIEVGSARARTTVRVTAPDFTPIPEPPIIPGPQPTPKPVVEKETVDLKINGEDGPLSLSAPASLNISWNVDRYCLAYGSWLGVKRKAGEEQRIEQKAGVYNYRLYCPGVGSDTVTVNIGGGKAGDAKFVPLPVAEATVSTDGENYSRSIRVTRGEPVTLWLSAAQDANGDRRASRDAAGGWGGNMVFGGRCEWNLDLNRDIPTFEGAIFDPSSPEECTVSLSNVVFADAPGVYRYGILRLVQRDGKVSDISYINVSVQAPPEPDGPPVIDFRVNGLEDFITLGAPAQYTLSWLVHNANTCAASDAWEGEKLLNGTQKFVASSKRELTYTLTCQGKLGETTKSIFVKVAELPVCDFSALPTVLDSRSVFGRQSVLSWKCQFANSCSIFPDVGALIDTFGSLRVSPSVTTTYILTCTNLDGSSDFPASVEVR